MDGVDGVKGTAGKRKVSIEVAAQHGFNGTFGDGLSAQSVCA